MTTKKYTIKESPYRKQKKGITFSHSSLDTMEKCEREYFLRYIAKVKVPDKDPCLAFGNIIHTIAENYSGDGQDEIKALFECFQTDEKLKEKYFDKLDDKYKSKLLKALKNLYLWFKENWEEIKETYRSEQVINVPDIDEVDGVKIHLQGKLDGLFLKDDALHISDFKTGKRKKNHSTQLGFYYYLLQLIDERLQKHKIVGDIIYTSLDANVPYDKIKEEYELDESDLNHAHGRIKRAITKLRVNGITKEDIDNWPKKPQRLCDWCKYKKAGTCNGKKDD